MTQPGRNDPCPCGSGRKYKKCCGPDAELTDFTWRKMRQAEGELTEPLTEFAIRRYGPDSPNQAWDEYTFWEDAPMDPESEPELEASFPQWFLFCWTPDNTEKEESEWLPEMPIALSFLKEHPERVEPFQRRFIEEICSQPYSFFMVAGAEPGRHLRLKDLLLERELLVLERTSSITLVKGQILYTRVVTLDGISIMVGCAPVAIPAAHVNELIDFREKIKSRFLAMNLDEYGVSVERLEPIFDEMLIDAIRNRDLELGCWTSKTINSS